MFQSMDTSWVGKFFSRVAKFDMDAVRTRADQGDADAQFTLGLKYGASVGSLQDLAQAAHWYRMAAEQNHALAQFNLALMYAKGDGVLPDEAEALRWIRKAAHLGDAGAQFNLGVRYHCASAGGPPLDALQPKIEAYKWLQLAAAQGYKGSVAAWERVALSMTREEVAAGNQGAVAFATRKSGAREAA